MDVVPSEKTPGVPDEIWRRQVAHAAGEMTPGRGPRGRAGGQVKVPHDVAVLLGFTVPFQSQEQDTVQCNYVKYSVTHLLANLGWVDFDLGCSTMLPSCPASSANFPSAQAEPGRGWNNQNTSQPNRGSPGDVSPCNYIRKVSY